MIHLYSVPCYYSTPYPASIHAPLKAEVGLRYISLSMHGDDFNSVSWLIWILKSFMHILLCHFSIRNEDNNRHHPTY